MAIRLHIQENRVRLSVGGDTIHLSATEKMPVYPDAYTGAYEVTPIEAEQSLVTHGLMMTDDVTVHAIASDYVGSGISRRSSTDITASGATVSVPSGFYESPASKSVASGSASTPATSITATPSISVSQSGLITASVSASKDVTPSVSPGYVENGSAGTVNVSGRNTTQLTTKAATTITPTRSEQTAVGANIYTTGAVKVGAIPPEYIIPSGSQTVTSNDTYDVTSLAEMVVDVPAPSLQSKSVSYTPTETAQTDSVSADSGYDGLSGVGVSVGAIPSNYVGSGITRRSSSDLTSSGATVTVPSGYYANNASKAVGSGTAGTPTASKGTVSNHSMSVTPSVTNTAGYISGGTKTGTAVSVSASDLVSGTLSITSSGTKDVTNYASASVASGGATASATKGAVSNHSVTVTPSVTKTAGYITAGTASGTAVTVSASELVSGSETKTANGTYDVTNLAELVVNVSGGGTLTVATKTLTHTSTGQTLSFTSLSGQPKYWFLRTTTNVSSSGSTTYYYVTDLFYDGTNIKGNTFRIGSTRRVQNITSGITQSYSNGTLTITAGSSSGATPGQFYGASNFGYELIYIY